MTTASLCRDCFARSARADRCTACGSPRLLAHGELDQLAIAHVDCDAFYAAVEKRDDPSLLDKPVIIGGGRRGVVSTCCYVARTYGVRSAMPMFKALAACPDAVVIRPDMAKYARIGRDVRAMMLRLTPLVEPLSIDEAFLDLSGTERLHGGSPAQTLVRFAASIEHEIGITVSIGLSYNKFLAKIASELDKPRGFQVIGAAEAVAFLGTLPIGKIWGVGRVAEKRFHEAGIRLIGDLHRMDQPDLYRHFGSDAPRLFRLARGIDERAVEPTRETKSISAETTFDTDMGGMEPLIPILWRLCEKVSARLKKAGMAGTSITLKLKTADFQIRTRSRSGLAPTQLAKRLFDVSREMLEAEPGSARYRLIGVGMSSLCDPMGADEGDLVDTDTRRNKAAETAMDRLRDKYGDKAISRGIGLGGSARKG